MKSISLAAAALAALALFACGKPRPAEPQAKAAPPAAAAPAAPPAPAGGQPPAVWIAKGACPFEGCQYTEWTVIKPPVLYDAPGGAVLPVHLKVGDKVKATTGEVHARPVRAIVTAAGKEETGWGLTPGAVVYVLYPLGEGAVAVWKDGQAYEAGLDFEFRPDPPRPDDARLDYDWWGKVTLPDGSQAWVKEPGESFDGIDGLA